MQIKHHDAKMRTTLTVDDDLAEELKRVSASSHKPFKVVVNELLRRGLTAGSKPLAAPKPFEIEAKACGFLPGIDPLKLNQLADEMEADNFAENHQKKRRKA